MAPDEGDSALRPPQPNEGSVDGGGSGAARKRRRWRRPALLVLVVAAVAAVVTWAVWPSSPPKTAISIPPISSNAVTTTGGQELIATLQRGEAVTYHAHYAVTGSSQQGSTLSLEVWQSPPNVREDTVISGGGHTATTESFQSAKSAQVCTQTDGGAWSCRTVAKSQSTVSGVGGIEAFIADTVSGHGVGVSTRTIGGTKVTCFTVATSTHPRLCANSDGVPVQVSDASVTYQLQNYSTNVPAGAFTPPAS
ncbi:MAG TPA: hypothetical protein VGF87_04560 [Acidimicrobiales bacterium]|jgi:hypothetical protein